MTGKQIMEGVKIADFSWVGVGPMAAKAFAEHGATVIRVESHKSPDPVRLGFPFKDNKPGINRGGLAPALNTNKFGISLNLKSDKGREAALRLVKWADIVTESYTPGVMAKFGLDYAAVKKINPEVIYFSTTQQGQYGPYAQLPGYGFQGAAGAGFSYVMGWPDREPLIPYGAYTDYIAPWYLIVVLVGALIRKRRTGKGMYLDQSQCETAIHFLEPAILDYTVNGRIMGREGNRYPSAVPHNAYRCKGHDRWVAITVFSEKEWQALCQTMGKPELKGDPKFATFLSRKKNEEELDKQIGSWTKDYDAEEIMFLLQNNGVPAGVVKNCQDLFEDPQIKHRNHFVWLNHREIGSMAYRTPAYKLSKSPSQLRKPGPCLGEDNEYVYKEILNYSDDEFTEMIKEGAIT